MEGGLLIADRLTVLAAHCARTEETVKHFVHNIMHLSSPNLTKADQTEKGSNLAKSLSRISDARVTAAGDN